MKPRAKIRLAILLLAAGAAAGWWFHAWRSGSTRGLASADFASSGSIFEGPSEVHLRSDGSVRVAVHPGPGRTGSPLMEGEYLIPPAEAETLADLLRKVDTLGETDESPPPPDTPTTTLRTVLDGRTCVTRWANRPSLSPVNAWFRRFTEQTVLLAGLRSGEGIRRVDEALDPRALRVAQPAAFLLPLQEFVAAARDPADALISLGTLARIEDPAEWGAVAARKAGTLDPAARAAFLEGLVVDGFLPADRIGPAHRAALLPAVLASARSFGEWGGSDPRAVDRENRLVTFLAVHQYGPAYAAIPAMVKESPDGARSFAHILWGHPDRADLAGLEPREVQERRRIQAARREEALRGLDALAGDAGEEASVRARARELAESLRARP